MQADTLKKMIAEDEFGILDFPADTDEAADGWTWGEVRAIASALAASYNASAEVVA